VAEGDFTMFYSYELELVDCGHHNGVVSYTVMVNINNAEMLAPKYLNVVSLCVYEDKVNTPQKFEAYKEATLAYYNTVASARVRDYMAGYMAAKADCANAGKEKK